MGTQNRLGAQGQLQMKINIDFLKRRWFDFRSGHSTYLIFIMAFMQFVVVTYALAIERLPALSAIFPSMFSWIAAFVGVYVPAAILIGRFHHRHQVAVDQEAYILQNPRLAWVWLIQSRIARGVATEQEIEQYETYLQKIAGKL